MKNKCLGVAFFLCSLMSACLSGNKQPVKTTDFTIEQSILTDSSRNRKVPIAIYVPTVNRPAIVVFSHGYGQNREDTYLHYSYLTEYLASKGYFVVSIQHELVTDSLIPSSGVPQIVRRPFWERGTDNIRFVIDELKKSGRQLDFRHITLIGHSNGADMTALFPERYPNMVSKIITLDNRRMALPRTNAPKVYSLRSSDQPADEGVLPDENERKKYGITIIKLPNTIHNDMDDHANATQREEIRKYVLGFLRK